VKRLLVLAMLVTAACGSQSRAPVATHEIGKIAVTTEQFPHALHTGDRPELRNWRGRGVTCADCHDPKAAREGRVARPGYDQHAPCDECHRAEFEKPPGKLCRVCHLAVDPTTKGGSPLGEYPKRGVLLTLGSEFSHRLHLDPRQVGERIGCETCHARDPKTHDPTQPGHRECARCHERAPQVKQALSMDNCGGCHPVSDRVLPRCMLITTSELVFHHATHERERGNPIRCETCHNDAVKSKSRTDMPVPAMERCAQCHEDAARTPEHVRMSNCAGCHLEIDEGVPPMVDNIAPVCFTDEERRR